MKPFDNQTTDERAVSPVLGVALLVAMTVVLAGVIGFVVLGVDSGSADAPQPKLEFRNQSGDAVMVHEGGDKLNATRLDVKVDGSGSASSLSGEIAAGDSVTVATGITSSDTIRVIWNDPGSDRDVVLAEYRVE